MKRKDSLALPVLAWRGCKGVAMSRAEVDRDGAAQSRDGGGLGSADDLLAQLAGDEVERLLSDAEAGGPEPLNVDRAAFDAAAAMPGVIAERADGKTGEAGRDVKAAANLGGGSAKSTGDIRAGNDSVFDATEAAIDGLFDDADEVAAPGAGAAVEKSAGPAPISTRRAGEAKPATVDNQSIEEVITRRAQDLIAQAREEAVDEIPKIGAEEPLSAADALAAEMDADERAHEAALKRLKQGGEAAVDHSASGPLITAKLSPETADAALDELAASAEATVRIDEEKVDYTQADPEPRVPLLVRVLELMNAPLVGLSESVRVAMGKVAIVTSLNAVGVLVYVLVFRRH
jgi:hypothetical protein